MQKIKVRTKIGKVYVWVHFCYTPSNIKNDFEKYVNLLKLPYLTWVMKWATEDFGADELDTIADLDRLKDQIKEAYKELYPDLYIESNTDNQGWTRVWCTKHMMKELEYIGKNV